MKTLHIIRDPQEILAIELATQQLEEVALLLMQDGVFLRQAFPGRIYALADDSAARNLTAPYEPVDYEGAVKLIFEYDKVVVW